MAKKLKNIKEIIELLHINILSFGAGS